MFSLAALTALSVFCPLPARPQERAATFDAPLVTLWIEDRYGVLVDLDDDGFMDAVSWWWAGGYAGHVELKGWHNDGQGRFEQVWSTIVYVHSGGSPTTDSFRLTTCQLDPDGKPDFALVFSDYAHVALRALRSRGLEAPELVPQYSTTWGGDVYLMRAVVADFTGDGYADVAHSVNWRLRVLEFVPGQPTLLSRIDLYPWGFIGDNVDGLMRIDANGDETPDLLAWHGSELKLFSMQNGVPTATQTLTQGITEDHMPAAGDIDGDGDEDIVIWDMSRYVIVRRTGAATWSVEPPVVGGPAEYLVDVDRDGDLDGVCCGGGLPDATWNRNPSTLRIALNDGTGSFAPALETSWLGSDRLAGIADLDHDGDLDIVSGRCILYGRGALTDMLLPSLGNPKSERASGDFDGDADPDFDLGLRTIARNLGTGLCTDFEPSFPDDPELVGPGWPGDFDGDGDLDLFVKRRVGAVLVGQVLLRNQGGGSFVDAGPAGPSGVDFHPDVANADDPAASLAADADGDGDVDLVVRSLSGARVSRMWWNSGTGFVPGPEFLDEVVHAVADLNSDGIPDVVGVTSDVGWHAGLGGQSFGPHSAFEPLHAQLDRFALADFDADGDLDFAIAGQQPYLRMYWNDGTGGFQVQNEYLVSFGANAQPPRRVWSADVDQDGLLDLLVAPALFETNGLRILKRRANNSGWQAPDSQIVFAHDGVSGIRPDALLADVDGDGDDDFVTDRLVRNATFTPPESGRRRQVEDGTPGTDGLVPTLGAAGPFRLGEIAEVRLRGGLGGARGVLMILRGDGESSPLVRGHARSASVLARIPFVLDGEPGVAGTGGFDLRFRVSLNYAGLIRGFVAKIEDPVAPAGTAQSNTLVLSFGP